MSVIRIDRYDRNISGTSGTITIDNVTNISNAFIRIVGSSRQDSGGEVLNTSDLAPNIVGVRLSLTGTTEVTFNKQTTNTSKIMFEVWVYIGAPGGIYEFVSRQRGTTTLTGSSATIAVSGITTRNNCIPFYNGYTTAASSSSDWGTATIGCHLNTSSEVVFSRNNTGTSAVCAYDLVEFTGSAWLVGCARTTTHGDGSSFPGGGEVVTINQDSDGTSGTTLDILNWSNAMIIQASMEGDSIETGLSDTLLYALPGSSSNQVRMTLDNRASNNDGAAYAYVLGTPTLSVYRSTNSNIVEGNNSYGTDILSPTGTDYGTPINSLALEWFPGTSGEGRAHARGALNAIIIDSGSSYVIRHWVHRSGNTVRAAYAIVDLSQLLGDDPIIFSVDGGDNQIVENQQNIVIDGVNFGATQGTGTLEFLSDLVGTITVLQTVDSWTDEEIVFDLTQGALTEGTTIYAKVTDDDSNSSGLVPTFFGVPDLPDYFTVIDGLGPNHWWRFNDDGYADSVGANPITTVVTGGGGTFVTEPICEQNTHAWRVNDQPNGQKRTCDNSTNINDTQTVRAFGGWIRLGGVDPALTCIYEEGGSVNNVAFFTGMGNVLIASYADSEDDNVQSFSNDKLDPDRDYLIMFRFDHAESPATFDLYLDGIKQENSVGNPMTSGDLDAHSSNISFGGPSDSLEVGGTDVVFPSQRDTYYANWFNWTTNVSDSGMLELFHRGARPVTTIASDTQVNMQIAIDALADTVRDNASLSIRIMQPSTGSGAPLALDFDNITFNSNISMEVEWRGGGTLTITNLNGSNTNPNKCFTFRGGNITVVNPATLTLTGLQNPTEVRVYEAGTSTEIAGQEEVTTGTFSTTVQTEAVDIAIVSIQFQNIFLRNVDTSATTSLPIQQRFDRNYRNP